MKKESVICSIQVELEITLLQVLMHDNHMKKLQKLQKIKLLVVMCIFTFSFLATLQQREETSGDFLT